MTRGGGENAKPKRLLRRNGKWTLELESLVSLPDNVLRPVIEKIEGDDVILYHLESSPAGHTLANAASRLLRSTNDPNDERAFEAKHGAWVPAMPHRPPPQPAYNVERGLDVEAKRTGEVGMRTEMATMALAFERIARRLTEVEKKQMHAELPQDLAMLLDELENENRTLRGRVEDLEVQVQELVEAAPTQVKETAQRAVEAKQRNRTGARTLDGANAAPALGMGDEASAVESPSESAEEPPAGDASALEAEATSSDEQPTAEPQEAPAEGDQADPSASAPEGEPTETT